MLVSNNNSFDLWQKDAFFSAAEEVQQSADILESMYRMWVRRREGQEIEYSDDLRRELQIALGTAKWQLDEFERAVRLSDGYRSQDNAKSRHKQFIDVMEEQISRVEKALRESLAEEKQPLCWVSLDIEESDDFAAFLSGTSGNLQNTTDKSLDIGLSKKSFFPRDQITPDNDASGLGVTPDCITNYKEIVTIKKDSTYVVELEAKDIARPFDDTELAGQGKTWTSPNFGSWKIVIADEDEHAKTLETCDESSTKGKGFTSNLWRPKGGEHFQAKGGKLSYLLATGINRFSKFLKRLSGVQKQLQGQQYNQITRFIQIILLLILAIFLVGKLYDVVA
ncbi:Syntaxin/t-SNARE family protein [Thalictrum thalictroides]|uniref:Syntaxin/t-SNARE family protein n=1 Tax=Thalictrum thalictroides TaxID=46969 RepID=A0A7J6WKV8_THATH|nr:Syntaxin/t-SNARE family protein [Thalictrum thalictroides]